MSLKDARDFPKVRKEEEAFLAWALPVRKYLTCWWWEVRGRGGMLCGDGGGRQLRREINAAGKGWDQWLESPESKLSCPGFVP